MERKKGCRRDCCCTIYTTFIACLSKRTQTFLSEYPNSVRLHQHLLKLSLRRTSLCAVVLTTRTSHTWSKQLGTGTTSSRFWRTFRATQITQMQHSAIVRSAMDVYQIALTIDGVEAIMISEDSIPRFEGMSFPQLPGINKACHQVRKVGESCVSLFMNTSDAVPLGHPNRIIMTTLDINTGLRTHPSANPGPSSEPSNEVNDSDEDIISASELRLLISEARRNL